MRRSSLRERSVRHPRVRPLRDQRDQRDQRGSEQPPAGCRLGATRTRAAAERSRPRVCRRAPERDLRAELWMYS